MLNDKHDSYSVNSLLICAQAALLGGTASNHDVINLLDVAQDIISSTMNSFTDSSAPGANVDLFTKKVTSRRNNSATCPDFFSNQMKEKDFFLFVVFVFSGRFWLFSSFVYCTVYCKNGL